MVMPLGVIANQLVKIEGDLRFLSMKAAEHADEEGAPCSRSVDARLELIYDVLESIHSLLARLQTDIHPKAAAVAAVKHEAAPAPIYKPSPEQDD